MWYQINEYPEIGSCTYRLWYLDKFIVIKCKTMFRSVQNLNTGLMYFFKNTKKGRNPNDLYFNFYNHVADNPFNKFKIDLILVSENPYELLKAEYLSLEAGFKENKCLNANKEPYVPQYTQVNGKKSWINRGFYLNFMDWKKTHEINRNKTA